MNSARGLLPEARQFLTVVRACLYHALAHDARTAWESKTSCR